MRKTRIEVKADTVVRADACEARRLAANNWRDMTIDIADSNDKANNNSTNMDLVEFGVHIKTLLADSILETCRKWAIKDYINSNNINVITSLIINLGAENANHIENFLLIRHCQIAKFDCLHIGNINNINKDIMLL